MIYHPCLFQLFGRRKLEENRLKCWLGVKVFGNEISVITCDDLYDQINQVSLSMAGLAVKLLKVAWMLLCSCYSDTCLSLCVCVFPDTPLILLSIIFIFQGHDVQLTHRAVLLTEEVVLPSLAGVPLKLGINMTSLLSLRLKGNVSYRDTSHFSLSGYIKPKYFHVKEINLGLLIRTIFHSQQSVTSVFVVSAYVGLSARMGVDSALGQAAVEWVSELSSSTSLDGSIQLQEGRDVRVTLNTPEDLMDIISLRYSLWSAEYLLPQFNPDCKC